MRSCNNFCRLDGTVQITGYNGIQGFVSQTFGNLPCLLPTLFIQLTLCLTLHDLSGIIHRFAMTYEYDYCLHACKITI